MIIKISDILKILRKMAKDNYWQILYQHTKEGNLSLFKNNYDLTSLQIKFLNDLSMFNIILLDISMGDVDDIVLMDDIYIDAYMYYRRKKRYEISQTDNKPQITTTSQWVFKRPIIK